MDTYDKIQKLMEQKGVRPYTVSKATGISTGLFSQWKKRSQKPSMEKLTILAEYFGVGLDYFQDSPTETKKEPTLSEKDERDVLRKLEETLDSLGNAKDGLMFDGEPLDDETWELLRESIYQDLRMAKLAAKKYTPKKYRKE